MPFKKGNIPWIKGKYHTEKTKLKMRKPHPGARGEKNPAKRPDVRKKIGQKNRIIVKALWQNPEYLKMMSEAHKGKKASKKTKQKMSEKHKGHSVSRKTRLKISQSKKGHIVSEKTRKKISQSTTGRKLSLKTRMKMGERERGNKHWNWKGGISTLAMRIRSCYKYHEWHSRIFKKDRWICRDCGKKERKIIAHHLKPFSFILMQFQIKTLEEAISCKELWDVNNGITLCEKCHKKRNKMFKTLIKIQELLKNTFGDLFTYFIDDPNLIPFSELPCLYIAPVSTDINIADNQRDNWTYTIEIGIIIDAKQELLKYKQEMVGTQFLTEVMEAKDDNGMLKANTILYVLRANLNLGSNWNIQNISSADYSVRLRGEIPDQFVCKEATLRLTVTRIQNRP